jgi:hypothetical protein
VERYEEKWRDWRKNGELGRKIKGEKGGKMERREDRWRDGRKDGKTED